MKPDFHLAHRQPIALGAFVVALVLGGASVGQGTSSPSFATQPVSTYRIVVEPNIRASHDGDFAHGEPEIAANPLNARNLVGSSIAFTNSGVGAAYEVPAYTSMDGGWTWKSIRLPGQELGTWDTQVKFGVSGTAFILGERGIEGGHNALALWRSEDGGLTWQKPVDTHRDLDRNVLAVDHSRSKYRGHVYIASNARGMVLYHSADDGKTFRGPREWGCQRMIQMLVLSDGTLWIPCDIVKEDVKKAIGGKQGISMSTDGGETFTPHFAFDVCVKGCATSRDYKRGEVTGYPYNGIVFALDTTARFRDRIYAVWPEVIDGAQDVWIRYSNDRGKTWSTPKHVAAPSAQGAKQFLPVPATNRDGVLGIFWLEALPPNRSTTHGFFAASVDGGETFLPARQVTSEVSRPDNPGNYALTFFGNFGDSAQGVANFSSGIGRMSTGGEYLGLAADADGVFHPFWPDARGGTFQLYSSRVTVTSKPASSRPARLGDSARRIDGSVAIVYEPPVTPTGDERNVVARIRNVSRDTIWGPIVLVVGIADMFSAEKRFAYLDTTVSIFDSSSQQWRVKARIDYTAALRDQQFLAPGASTEALPWRFRSTTGYLAPNVLWQVWAGPRSARQQSAEEEAERAEIERQKAARAKKS